MKCFKFPGQKFCGCTIPCLTAIQEVTLDEIRPGLYLGPVQAAYKQHEMAQKGVKHVINCSNDEYHEWPGI